MEAKESYLNILPCPIMDKEVSIYYTIGLEIAKVSILKSFEGNPLTVNKLRDKYTELWDKYWSETYGKPAESPTGPYWIGPKKSILVANKIISFLNEYEIVSPMQPYSYTLGSLVVEGISCIVRKKSNFDKERSYFTVILQDEVTEESCKPSVPAITKWYYVETTYGSFLPSGILYVPIIKGKIKQSFIKNIPLAKQWIEDSFKTTRYNFPITGLHCSQCKSKKCEEVLNVGQNEDRRVKWLREVSSTR